MTEIPEHLRKRAEAARAKAEAEKGGADEPAVDAPADEPAAADPAESRIPAHLLERSRAAKAKAEGGEADLNPEEKKTIMGGLIAKEMCKPEGYFASCATFEAGECEALTVASFRACADENPEALEKLDEESSQALGVCTGKSALLKVAGEGKLSIEGPCANPEQFP